MSSIQAESFFKNSKPKSNGEEIVVLQVVEIGGLFWVEFIRKEDYDAENIVFNPDGSQKS